MICTMQAEITVIIVNAQTKKQLLQVARIIVHANERLVGVNEYLCLQVCAYASARVPAEITQRSPDAFTFQAATVDEACVAHWKPV